MRPFALTCLARHALILFLFNAKIVFFCLSFKWLLKFLSLEYDGNHTLHHVTPAYGCSPNVGLPACLHDLCCSRLCASAPVLAISSLNYFKCRNRSSTQTCVCLCVCARACDISLQGLWRARHCERVNVRVGQRLLKKCLQEFFSRHHYTAV